MEMLKIALSAMGVDPERLLGQAGEIGSAFKRVEMLCLEIQQNQHTLMAHFGLEIPPPSPEQAALIASESARVIAASTAGADGGMNGHGR